jgi:hypothetical protein
MEAEKSKFLLGQIRVQLDQKILQFVPHIFWVDRLAAPSIAENRGA